MSKTNGAFDHSPTAWSSYFRIKDDVQIETDTFRIYRLGYEGALLFCIHGGGFSALSWALFCKNISSDVKCQCMAVDVRGHGDSNCADERNLSIEKLTSDIIEIILTLYPTEAPPIILIGHSMGGAIAINVAASKKIPSLAAVCVIDVVEGSAMQTLKGMEQFLNSRPKIFKSIQDGIFWSYRMNQIRNIDSARVSFPGQIKCVKTNETATKIIENAMKNNDAIKKQQLQQQTTCEGNNNEELQDPLKSKPLPIPTTNELGDFTWRVDLLSTSIFWKDWFSGMSKKFLSITEPKLLILAGVDRLDRELMIGHMQGKFQVEILRNAGHIIHEDDPKKVSDIISQFLIRYQFAAAKSQIDNL